MLLRTTQISHNDEAHDQASDLNSVIISESYERKYVIKLHWTHLAVLVCIPGAYDNVFFSKCSTLKTESAPFAKFHSAIHTRSAIRYMCYILVTEACSFL